jgi:two-component system, OmpR family, KDP operon response regulator KdpE
MMNGFWRGTVFSKALERTTMGVQKVLVVDDEAPMRRVLRASLMLRGYNVVEAESGEEALDRFNGERCDLVLLDLNLPGIDGIDTCRAIRANSDVPVIVVSIRDSEKDRAAAHAAGANDYVTNTFTFDTIVSRIQEVSRSKNV